MVSVKDVKWDENVILNQLHRKPGVGFLGKSMNIRIREIGEGLPAFFNENNGVDRVDGAVAEFVTGIDFCSL